MPSTSCAGREPGKHLHIVNLGCKVNKVEADSLAARLVAGGWQLAEATEADLIVVNTCTVTAEADKKARKALRAALRANAHARVVATGCAAAIDPEKFKAIDERVEVGSADALADALGKHPRSGLRLGSGFRTRVSIKVQDGCNHACTYCIVHVARGKARSAPLQDVLAEAEGHLAAGAREIVLAGIDLGSYSWEGARLADLVSALLEAADKHAPAGKRPCRIRASSVEPRSVDEPLVDLVAESEGRLCRHLHLPLQSGSSRVLAQMGRPYDAQEYLQLVGELRRRVPSLSLTTDIICGFPGETEDDFAQTVELAKRCRFSKIHVFPYSRRENTPAAAMEGQIDARVKARRASELREISRALREADLGRRAGSRELALVETEIALSESYHELAIPEGAREGELVEVML